MFGVSQRKFRNATFTGGVNNFSVPLLVGLAGDHNNDDDDGDGDADERRRMMAMLLVIIMTWQVTTMCSVKSALLGSLNFFSMSLHR